MLEKTDTFQKILIVQGGKSAVLMLYIGGHRLDACCANISFAKQVPVQGGDKHLMIATIQCLIIGNRATT